MLLSYDLAGTLAVKNMCLEGMGHRTNELSGKKKIQLSVTKQPEARRNRCTLEGMCL